jgi:hypothetical protein
VPEQARGMTTTELIRPPRASGSPGARPAAATSPAFGDVLAETAPLVGVIAVAGPPVLLIAGPWLLFGLLLAGPFALLLTIVVLLGAATALVGLIRALVATSYRLFRDLGKHAAQHRSTHVSAAQLVVRRGAA